MEAFQQKRVPNHPAAWAELADVTAKNRTALRQIRWGPVLFGALAVSAALNAFTEPRRWFMAALFGGLAASYPLLYRRIRGQVEAAERVLG